MTVDQRERATILPKSKRLPLLQTHLDGIRQEPTDACPFDPRKLLETVFCGRGIKPENGLADHEVELAFQKLPFGMATAIGKNGSHLQPCTAGEIERLGGKIGGDGVDRAGPAKPGPCREAGHQTGGDAGKMDDGPVPARPKREHA